MSSGSVLVIGGGVAGLSAAIYAAANGYETTILEMHTLPGGLCTSWDRQGYTFDGCIHWFVGGKPGSGFRPLWEEVGAMDGTELIAHDRLSTIRDADGNSLDLWADLDRIEREGTAKWPNEARGFKHIVEGARVMAKAGSNVPTTPPDMMGMFDGLKMLVKSGSSFRKMRRYYTMSMDDLADQFADPFLRRAVSEAITEPRMSAMAWLGTLGWFDAGDANWVMGGSLAFARKLETRLLASGGEITYGAKVDRILVEGDRAVGVRLADGSEQRADHVIGAADGHATIFEMLGGKYADQRVRDLYDKLEPFPPIIQVSLGVDMDLSDMPWSNVLLLGEGEQIGGKDVRSVWTHHYCYDPSMAPAGKSVITTILAADLEPWQHLRDTDRAAYKAKKASVAEEVIGVVERAYPGIREHVEVIDVATPATYVRYTGNWRASFEGWLLSPGNTQLAGMGGLPRKLPGLSNFVMAGQWVWPGGGLPSGVLTGRWAVQTICAADQKELRAARLIESRRVSWRASKELEDVRGQPKSVSAGTRDRRGGMSENGSNTTSEKAVIDGHRLAEFVYGTVTGMVALAGIGGHPAGGWLATAGAVVAGAVAIWLAHGYSIMLSTRVTVGHRLTGHEIGHAFYGSWPIVIAGVVLSIPILATGVGLWSLETSVQLAGWLGVAILALVGVLAGSLTHETWARRLLIATLSAGLGVLVVAIEFIVHH